MIIFFPENKVKIRFDISPKKTICIKYPTLFSGKISKHPLESICMKCQILFSREKNKTIINLPSVKFTHSVLCDKYSLFFQSKSTDIFAYFSMKAHVCIQQKHLSKAPLMHTT